MLVFILFLSLARLYIAFSSSTSSVQTITVFYKYDMYDYGGGHLYDLRGSLPEPLINTACYVYVSI